MFNQAPKNYQCPFCRIVKSGIRNDSDFVYETETVFVLIARDQHQGSGPGLLVIPKVHVENLYDIEDSLLSESNQIHCH